MLKFSEYLTIHESAGPGKKVAVMTFGRMNPPTIGHMKLAKKLQDTAKKVSGDAFIFLSKKQEKKKDPLNPMSKVKWAKKSMPKGITIEAKQTMLHAASDLYGMGYTDLVVIVGSDRIAEFQRLLPAYNGQEKPHGFYDFASIKIESAGERDPDSDGVEGMSASKLRGFVKEGDSSSFAKGVNLSQKDAMMLFNELKREMGVGMNEEIELDEVLDTRERAKKAAARANRLADKEKHDYLTGFTSSPEKWKRKSRQFMKFKTKAMEELDLDFDELDEDTQGDLTAGQLNDIFNKRYKQKTKDSKKKYGKKDRKGNKVKDY